MPKSELNNVQAHKATIHRTPVDHSLGVVVKQADEALGPRGVNVKEEGQVHHYSQGEQQCLHQ